MTKSAFLIVVDVQKDFVDGSLGTPEAREMYPRLLDKVRNFKGRVLFTLDTHGNDYATTQEGRNLPVPHCIKGTSGWELMPELRDFASEKGCTLIEKPTFGSEKLAALIKEACAKDEVESVELAGLCTDICVISNALLIKAVATELPVSVDASCCAGVTPAKHAAALEILQSCQVKVSNAA